MRKEGGGTFGMWLGNIAVPTKSNKAFDTSAHACCFAASVS